MNASDSLPLNPDLLESRSIVVDIVNSPEPTPLYRAASARGCRTQNGRPMHEGQAVHALRFLGFEYVPEGRPTIPNGATVSLAIPPFATT
jgi:shikimate dehydrogenase